MSQKKIFHPLIITEKKISPILKFNNIREKSRNITIL